jgi:hypothetical protein
MTLAMDFRHSKWGDIVRFSCDEDGVDPNHDWKIQVTTLNRCFMITKTGYIRLVTPLAKGGG